MNHDKKNRSPGRPRTDEMETSTLSFILDTATTMFLQQGFDKVSMESVARQCEVTKPTVYYYFKNKSELFIEVWYQLIQETKKEIQHFLNTEHSIYDTLVELAEAHIQHTSQMDLEKLMQQVENHIPLERKKELDEAYDSLILTTKDLFTTAIEKKEIRLVDPVVAAYTYNSLLILGTTTRPDGSTLFSTPSEAAENIVALLWNGLGLSSN